MEVIDLAGRKGLVVGVANADSLAWSAARHFRNAGAELAMTYYNEKARSFVAPLALAFWNEWQSMHLLWLRVIW